MLVVVTGPPGTGKSTVADIAARRLSAGVFAWDWVMAGMTSFDDVQSVFGQMPRERYRAVGWSIIWNLSLAQLRRGASVVVDGVARDVEIAAARQLAADVGTEAFVVATSCADPVMHRSRIEGRARNIPGWHELDWAHVQAVTDAWTPPTDADLHLDAAAPLADNERQLVDALTTR
jgi:predicted kinase